MKMHLGFLVHGGWLCNVLWWATRASLRKLLQPVVPCIIF